MLSCKPLPPFPHQTEVPLTKYSTFGIGGPARLFALATSAEQMRQMLLYAHEQQIPFLVIGKGSNLLFDDRGFNGLVILNKIVGIKQEGALFSVGSGESFPRLGAQTAKQGFHGLEFAAGIPATVGGAIYMNAGAGGQETFDSLVSVDYLTAEGSAHTFTKAELKWSYRYSQFQEWRGAIVGARFALSPLENAYQMQKKLVDYRLETQPYGMKSAGCVFRNPEGLSAGRMIEELGLKGLRMGGASISTKHANFIVNDAKASAADVLQLMEEIKRRLWLEKGISLHEEIRYIPYND